MTPAELTRLLTAVAAGELAPEAAADALGDPGILPLADACLDTQREARCGFPEVVYGAGKDLDQLTAIIEAFAGRGENCLVTRLGPELAASLTERFPEAVYDPLSRTLTRLPLPPPNRPGRVAVVTAGTSDSPVAAETVQTLRYFGYDPTWIRDVGVAGLHRLLQRLPELRAAQVAIVIAGMEGALPSVVGGLLACPVIGVPTSVGYGAALHGTTALLGMLSSCASGLTVCNIDNGFGAACAANRILRLLAADA